MIKKLRKAIRELDGKQVENENEKKIWILKLEKKLEISELETLCLAQLVQNDIDEELKF